MAQDRDSPIRLSITLPGSASLGAFQAGAVAALSVVIRSLRSRGQPVAIDAVGGASAGSIVAALFAHCLVSGRDAPALLRQAWVDEVDIGLLRSGGDGAPLAFDDLRERVQSFLSDTDEYPFGLHEPVSEPISVQVGLTSLLGFTTPVVTDGRASSTISYTDWMAFQLEPRSGVEAVTEPDGRSLLDAVLVSAAHPAAFSPRSLDRAPDRAEYEKRGIDNFPESGELWYTDGGLVESRPIGRVLGAARSVAPDFDGVRLHFVIDPRSSGPSGDREWGEPAERREWIDGVRRALSILPTQALHDDLRTVAATNDRLVEVEALIDRYDDLIGDDERGNELRKELARLAGVDDKSFVELALISPLLRARQTNDNVSELLAGDFIGAFGGFLDRSIRRSDFGLGWMCTVAWVEDELADRGVDQSLVDEVMATLDASTDVNWADQILDGDSIDQLSRTGRWQLALLALRFGQVLAREALPSPSSLARRASGRDRA